VPGLEAELDLLRIDGLSKIIADAQNLHARWPNLSPTERRNLVELILKDIIIGEGEVTLNLCYLLTRF
jgi:site-specific DNA recombinase